MKDKERNVLYITHSVELLIWLIFILFIIIIVFFSSLHKEKTSNIYRIYIPDADGLITGSPVRMMGIEVGHVVKIKPAHSNVYIKFVIDNDTVTIPQGTIATVEFSGMAGSKSLELYLPDEKTFIDSSTPLLSTNSPKRLHDAAGLLNEMFDKLGKIIFTTSRFGQKLGEIDMPLSPGGINDASKFLQFANETIDKSEQRAENLGRLLENGKRK